MLKEEMRNKLFQYLKQKVQWNAGAKKNARCSFEIGNPSFDEEVLGRESFAGLRGDQSNDLHSELKEIIAELISGGILVVGKPDNGNQFYPYMFVSRFGEEVVLNDSWLPYDPDGYLAELDRKVPGLDALARQYIAEAIQAFHRHLLLSGTVMLGVASENLMFRLIDAFADAIADPKRVADFKRRIDGRLIARQYSEFKKELEASIVGGVSLPENLKRDRETLLDGLFGIVRINRNKAGHPTGQELSSKALYAHLQMFPDYASFIAGFLEFLRANPV